jgi:hypothetical protein
MISVFFLSNNNKLIIWKASSSVSRVKNSKIPSLTTNYIIAIFLTHVLFLISKVQTFVFSLLLYLIFVSGIFFTCMSSYESYSEIRV